MTQVKWRARAVLAVLLMAAAAACSKDSTGSTPLATPTGLTAQQQSLTKIQLTWSAVSGATGYILERTSASTPGIYSRLGGGVLANTQFTDSSVAAGVSYGYHVASVSASDTSAFSGTVNFATGAQQAVLDGTADITASRTLYADTVYVLRGYVKVKNGATLTIQPGTKIVGDTTITGSSLWILRGSKLIANGTAAQPIVFTSQRAPGNRSPGDWGGIIIVGNGIINRTGATILTEGGAAGESENYAGGTDNNDSSGVLRYVRIEFAGYDVSNGAGQELNSLSMYAVGRKTVLEYVQTMSGLDDSFEWWGGAVDGRYLVSYESGDDHFDWTEGYQGRNQFLIAFQSQRLVPRPGTGVFSADPRGFEGDGCDPAVAGCTMTPTGASTPYSNPVFSNFTMIGPGQLAGIPNDGNGAVWRRGTAGYFANGVLARWKGIAINVRDAWTDSLLVNYDSLNIVNVLLAQNGFNYDTTGAGFGQAAVFAADNHKVYAGNVAIDTLLGISLNPSALDWTPKNGSPANTGSITVSSAKVSGYFGGTWANTPYLGAADPAGAKWWLGWTSYSIN